MNPPIRLPYPGLRAFNHDESDLFFGREGCVDAMVDHLAATRLLAVLGPSGSGKSSLVRTGFQDALDLGLHPWAGTRWKIADLHPGGQPMHNLAAALLEVKGDSPPDETDVHLLKTFLSHGPRSIVEWAAGGNLAAGWNLLLMVDQFEELFRYSDYAQREEAEAFVALLLESAAAAGVAIHVVVTMRSEYLGACTLISGLAERINAGLYLTPRMGRAECREAIEGPAGVMGFRVEPALVNQLLNDLSRFAPWEAGGSAEQAERLSRQADQLPVMQHVLNRLWVRAHAESNGAPVELRLSDYEQIGGLSGALDAHGAEIIAALGPERARHIEDVFRALISGSSVALAVRRPCRMGELAAVTGGARDDVVAIVEAFSAPGCNFMRTSAQSLDDDDVIVDITHESLIRQWTPLREWLEKEARAAGAWQRLLSAQERYVQGEGGLLTGLDLRGLVAWWESANPTPVWASRHGGKFDVAKAFLDASARAEAELADAERRRQIRERSRLRFGVAALATAFAIASVLCVWAIVNSHRFKAERQEAINQGQKAMLAGRNADQQRQAADRAKDSAVLEVSRTAHVLDDVSNLVHSDQYRNIVGVGELQSKLMEMLLGYQSALSLQHRDAIEQASIVRDEFRRGVSFVTIGKAREARDSFRDAYETGRSALPVGKRPPESLEVTFIEDGTRYAWFLFDTGEIAQAEQVRRSLEELANQYEARSTTPQLLASYGRFENLENRRYRDLGKPEEAKKHLLKARDFASRSAAVPNAPMDTLQLKFKMDRAWSATVQGSQEEDLENKYCALAEQMIQQAPMDVRAIEARVDCLRDLAYRANSKNDLAAAAERLQTAWEMLNNILRMAPDHQALLLDMASVETDIADNWSKRKDDNKRTKYNLEAKEHFVRALHGRTLFQSTTDQVKRLYQSIKSVDFPVDKELAFSKDELKFYEDIAASVGPTLEAFPKAPSFVYVAADASANIGRVLTKDPKRRPEAEKYLSQRIDSLNRMKVLDHLSGFSEKSAEYCGAYRDRAELYGAIGKVDLMLADVRRIKDSCEPWLKQYPWDFYVRSQLKSSSNLAGSVLFELHRYKDSLQYVDYASRWGVGDSSFLLARMYREGLGVPQDPQKAKDLETLAKKQTTKSFSIPADFGGTKTQFTFYCVEWPGEYPYEGIDDQVRWLKEARGGTVSAGVTDAFHKLQKYGRESELSFPDMCAYALSVVNNADKTQEVDAARKKYSLDPTAENLGSLRLAVSGRHEELVKAKKQQEADSLEQEVVEDAEKLVKTAPGAPSYRAAWHVLIENSGLKSTDPAAARKAFARSLELAELLPADNPNDLYKRLVSYERLGDQDAADKKLEAARDWHTKEVAAARKRFLLEDSPENLDSVRTATNRLYDDLVKLKQQPPADSLHKEVLAAADRLVTSKPGAPADRVAWSIFIDQGDRLRSTDATTARKAFARSMELAEVLPEDNAEDLYKRLVSYERLGDLDVQEKRVEEARKWYVKELEAARKRYVLEDSLEGFSSLRIASNRLYDDLVKLKRQPEADSLDKELTDAAERLVKKTPGAPANRVAWSVLTDQADHLKSADPASARKAYTRTVELVETLPQNNADDLYKRILSYERLGDQDVVEKRFEDARGWYIKELEAARKKYAVEDSLESFSSLRMASNRLYDDLVKLKRQSDADALDQELTEAADKLVKKTPGEPANRAAWSVFTDQGDHLKSADPASARKAFARTLELAEALPQDNADDLYKRLVSYERLGDQDVAEKRLEDARKWYAKEVETARKRSALEGTPESLRLLRTASDRLYEELVKLKQLPEVSALRKELIEAAGQLLAHSQSDTAVREAVSVYVGVADWASNAGNVEQARKDLTHGRELALKFADDTPDAAYGRYESLLAIGAAFLKSQSLDDARAAYIQASSSMERYLTFLTAPRSQRAADDSSSVAGDYGGLSWTYLLAGNLPKSMEAARQGLKIDPGAEWIEANLAHALLLSGKEREAVEHYMKVRRGNIEERSIRDATKEDFQILKSLGYTHPAMDNILKQMAEE